MSNKRKIKVITNNATGERTGFTPQANSTQEVVARIKDSMDYCLAEFREKHGNSKKPNIVIDMSNKTKIRIHADNY